MRTPDEFDRDRYDGVDWDYWEKMMDEEGPSMGVREPVRPPKPRKPGGSSLSLPEEQKDLMLSGSLS